MSRRRRAGAATLLALAVLQAGCSSGSGSSGAGRSSTTSTAVVATTSTTTVTPATPAGAASAPTTSRPDFSTSTAAGVGPSTTVAAPPPTASAAPASAAPASTVPASTASVPTGVGAADDVDLLAGSRVLCAFHGAVVPDGVLQLIRAGKAAGVIVFRENLTSQAQAAKNAAAIQLAAQQSPRAAPAIVAADQEGGQVKRVDGPPTAGAAELGMQPTDAIVEQGTATATNLRRWGIDVDLAPVADVARDGGFEVRQQRSFAAEPAPASAAVTAFVTGLHAGGIAATLKHFPGLGAAEINTDNAPSNIALDEATLHAVDAAPFAAGVQAGADLVMIASAIYPAFGPQPAVLSPDVVERELRQRLSFTGVTISDALDTPALAAYGTPAALAVTAAPAVDLFITSAAHDCAEIQRGLAGALRDGTLDLGTARAAAARIATLRSGLTTGSGAG